MADVVAAGQAEQIARLRLIRSENVGPVPFRQLITRFGNCRAALDALPELARRGGRRRFASPPRRRPKPR